MDRSAKLAVASGVGILAALWAIAAHAKGGGVEPPPGGQPPSGEPPTAPPHPKPTGPGDFKPPSGPDEPPAEGHDLTGLENNDYPTPGKFYQVKRGDIFLGEDSNKSIVYRALLSEGYVAAVEVLGYDAQRAAEYARNFARNDQNRLAYYNLILCLAYNDASFSTWGWDRQLNRAGPHGRAIPLTPLHVDNRSRLAATGIAARNVTLGQPGDEASYPIESGHSSFPYLFLPKLNRAAAAQGEVVEADPMDLPFEWYYQAGSLTSNRQFGCGLGTRDF